MPRTIVGDETKPPPRPVFARFECDADHGLLAPPVLLVDLFPVRGLAIDGWSAAVKHGWSVTPERTLCPECRRHHVAGNGNGHAGNGHDVPPKRRRGRPRKVWATVPVPSSASAAAAPPAAPAAAGRPRRP